MNKALVSNRSPRTPRHTKQFEKLKQLFKGFESQPGNATAAFLSMLIMVVVGKHFTWLLIVIVV